MRTKVWIFFNRNGKRSFFIANLTVPLQITPIANKNAYDIDDVRSTMSGDDVRSTMSGEASVASNMRTAPKDLHNAHVVSHHASHASE